MTPRITNASIRVEVRICTYVWILDFHRGMNTDFWCWGLCTVCEVNLPTTFREPLWVPLKMGLTAAPETSSRNLPHTHSTKSPKPKINAHTYRASSGPQCRSVAVHPTTSQSWVRTVLSSSLIQIFDNMCVSLQTHVAYIFPHVHGFISAFHPHLFNQHLPKLMTPSVSSVKRTLLTAFLVQIFLFLNPRSYCTLLFLVCFVFCVIIHCYYYVWKCIKV
jgi:hypothetical protein